MQLETDMNCDRNSQSYLQVKINCRILKERQSYLNFPFFTIRFQVWTRNWAVIEFERLFVEQGWIIGSSKWLIEYRGQCRHQDLLYTLALVHDTSGKHPQLEKPSNELDQTPSFGLLSSVVFVRVVQHNLFSSAFLNLSIGSFGSFILQSALASPPPMLKIFLTSIKKILSEELTTSDWFTLRIPNAVILNISADLLHHLPAESHIHF